MAKSPLTSWSITEQRAREATVKHLLSRMDRLEESVGTITLDGYPAWCKWFSGSDGTGARYAVLVGGVPLFMYSKEVGRWFTHAQAPLDSARADVAAGLRPQGSETLSQYEMWALYDDGLPGLMKHRIRAASTS